MSKIQVTKASLPNYDHFLHNIKQIFETHVLSNGPLVEELKEVLKTYLKVENLLLVTNGTIALQICLRALRIKNSAITTPFSFVATSNALIWENVRPIFADIDPDTYNINSNLLNKSIRDDTEAIVPVHVFGNPCNINKIEEVARSNNLRTLYDASHAFGVCKNNTSILEFGDASVISLHATKVFNTCEGAAIVFKSKEVYDRAKALINHGFEPNDHSPGFGTNAKMSELHAAWGLALFEEYPRIHSKRKAVTMMYDEFLGSSFKKQSFGENVLRNWSYYPIEFESEEKLEDTTAHLNANGIFPRRYFYPSLDEIYSSQICKISSSLSKRILCLPLSPYLEESSVKNICSLILGKNNKE